MRDIETIINGLLKTVNSLSNAVNGLQENFNKIIQFVQNFQQAVRLDSTGKEMRLLALQKLLIKKGLLTEAEMTEEVGEVIKQMQVEAEEQAKKNAEPTIVPATPEQTAQVATAPTTNAAVQEVVPPQA